MNKKHRFPSLWPAEKSTTDPFHSLQQQVDRLFNDFRSDSFPLATGLFHGKLSDTLVPRMDVSDSDTEVDIEMELPGVDKKDVDISVADNTITVKGVTEAKSEKDEKNYHLVERTHGSFYREIPLGFAVDEKQVLARFKNGVLHISVQKPAELAQEAKKIPIESAESD